MSLESEIRGILSLALYRAGMGDITESRVKRRELAKQTTRAIMKAISEEYSGAIGVGDAVKDTLMRGPTLDKEDKKNSCEKCPASFLLAPYIDVDKYYREEGE